MSIRRWVELSLVVFILSASRLAGAVVISPSAPSAALGNVVVNATGTGSLTLTTDTNNYAVDLVVSACTAGSSATATVGGNATNINLKTSSASTVDVSLTPTTRGAKSCTVNVYDHNTVTPSRASFTITATGIAPAINSPAPIVFATPVRYYDLAATHTAALNLVIQNTSNDAGQVLTITSVTLGGTNPGDYTITPPGSNNINPSSSGTWIVTFDPIAAGASSATITIDSNDPINPTRMVTVSGTGGTGVTAVSPPTIAFGTVGQGTTSGNSNAVVSNNGSGTKAVMAVTQAAFANNAAGWFKFNTAGCVLSTAPCALSFQLTSTTGNLPIVCAPPANASGSQSATVSFTTDAEDNTANTINLTCTAGRADIVVTTTPLDFGNAVIGTTTATQMVMIANTGNVALNYGFALTGTNPGQFTLAGNACTSGCSLAASSSVMVVVAFKPTATGTKTANLSVTPTNDPDTAGPIDVPLSGTGVAPLLALNVTPPLTFGAIDVGTTATPQTLTVTNNGTSDLTVSAAFLQAGAADYVTTGMTGASVSITIPATTSYSWTIACKPTVQGSRPGTFRITSDTGAIAGTNTDVGMTCTGNKGTLVVAVTPFDFGARNQGFMYTQNFTLTNTGNVPVTNVMVTPSGTGTGYSITAPATFPIASIAAGAFVTITVQFYPLDGTYGGAYAYTFTGAWGSGTATTSTTLNLNGDGLTTGWDTSPSNPNALDFGDVRFDQSKSLPLDVLNTAGSAYDVRTMTITPDAGTSSGEFSLVTCTHGGSAAATGSANGCPDGTHYFNSLAVMNDKMTVNIKCQPASRIGMLSATLSMSSNLAPPDDVRTVKLKCNATTGMLTINPGNVVDFGPVDLDSVPLAVTKTVTLTNSGAAPLSLGGGVAPVGRFAFSAMPGGTVAPGANYSFDVTYTPNTERLASQPDSANVTMALVGVYGMPSIPTSVTLTVQGYGVDRHIALAPLPVFPDTFKNPGTKAPILPVTVTNNGDAILNVSAVMLSNGPIWTIENPDPANVGGRESYDFRVKFDCITAGKAPTGHMVIMNNDNGMPMVSADLDGNCIDRQVAFGPPVIDVGYVGIGIPTRLSDVAHTFLDVTSMDDVNPFQISSIGIDGGNGAFQVVGSDNKPPTNLDLAPRATQKFDVIFTPNYEGDFEANASLYLDGASEPHATVVLRGRGLYVDVRGGGGCSTGSGSGGGALVLVLGALLVGRRRRRVLGAVATVLGAAGGVASAETRNLDTTLLDPTPATHVSGLQTQSADVGDSGEYAVNALFGYANNPLVLDTAQNNFGAVENRMVLQLGGAYAFGEKFEAGLRMPIFFQSSQGQADTQMFGVVPIGNAARGDATAHVKYHAGARDAFGGDLSYGFAASLTIPTRSGSEFAGTNIPQARLLALATQTNGRLVTQINAGGLFRSKDRYSSLVQRSGFTFGVGLSYRLLDNMWIGGEAFGNVIPGGHTAQPAMGEMYGAPETMSSIEALAEMSYHIGRATSLNLALGRGVTSGVGTANIHGALMVAYTPGATTLAPIHPYRPPEPPKDTDGDGVKDKLDACPNEPEDKDMFEDGDGCPDLDNDNDGFPDDKDKCPLDPEDKDHFQDDDGCPDNDNDNDGVPDAKDKCPLTAEDKDGFQDADGCPDPDNDGDGIIDTVDKCPKEPETINGNNDDDGCPDKGNPLVVLSPDRLDVLESIQFVGGGTKIAPSSKNVLGQIGATLRAHPEIVRVRLTAHVNPTSNASRDQKLSEERAKAVRQWLVDWGLDPLRMQSSGFGGTKPLVPATQRGAQEINDRFELIILERK